MEMLRFAGWTLVLIIAVQGNNGFCLENMYKTRFATVSNVSNVECTARGMDWCPLSSEIAVDKDGVSYYRYSPCCVGRQKETLLVEPGQLNGSGENPHALQPRLPTCKEGIPARECRRMQWRDKLFKDLLELHDYDFRS